MVNIFHERKFLKKAFTLSEALIAMAVLGIVAILTIVTLSNNSHRKHIVTAVRNNYSILNNAYELAVINRESPINWNLGNSLPQAQKSVLLANYFRPYLHIGVNCIGQGIEYTRNNCYRNISDDSTFTYVVLANGYILGFSTIDSNCANNSFFNDKKVCGEVDLLLNIDAKSYGRDIFQFFITTEGIIPFGLQGANQTFKLGCNPNTDTPYSAPFYKMSTCTAWVIFRENMDYLDCPDKLDWTASPECRK